MQIAETKQIMDVANFRARYPDWLTEVRPLLEEAQWGAALKTYPYPVSEHMPWTPYTGDLSQARLALLSTAGLYLAGEQTPFDAPNIEGDPTHREIPTAATAQDLAIAHTHYDHTHALADLNCVWPMERLQEMVAEGALGSLTPRHYSISGYCTRADLIAEETVPQVVAALREDGADIVLHVPV